MPIALSLPSLAALLRAPGRHCARSIADTLNIGAVRKRGGEAVWSFNSINVRGSGTDNLSAFGGAQGINIHRSGQYGTPAAAGPRGINIRRDSGTGRSLSALKFIKVRAASSGGSR